MKKRNRVTASMLCDELHPEMGDGRRYAANQTDRGRHAKKVRTQTRAKSRREKYATI